MEIYLISCLISTCLLSLVMTFDVSGGFCSSSNIQQSPVNIVQDDTVYYEEKYFRILTNRYSNLDTVNTWTYDANTRAVGVSPNSDQGNFGSVIFIKDWGFANLILQRINFRVGSSNQIDGSRFDAEMELIHTVDANYYSPGKRVDLGTNYVVISVPFKSTPDADPEASSIFKWMNLEGFFNGTNINMTRPIKLYTMVQHQPAYIYEGTLPFGDCLPAWYIQFSQYHLIKESDLTLLNSLTGKLAGDVTSNTRTVQPLKTVVYRNWDDRSKLAPNKNLLVFQSSSYMRSNSLLIIAVISIFLI